MEQRTSLAWRLPAEVDSDSAPRVQDHLTALLDGRFNANVLIDCSDVTYIDSTGLYVLMMVKAEAAIRDCDIVLLNPSRQLERVIQLTGLQDHFRVAAAPQP